MTSVAVSVIVGGIVRSALVIYRCEVYQFSVIGSGNGGYHIPFSKPVILSAILGHDVFCCLDHIGGTCKPALFINKVEGLSGVFFRQSDGG